MGERLRHHLRPPRRRWHFSALGITIQVEATGEASARIKASQQASRMFGVIVEAKDWRLEASE